MNTSIKRVSMGLLVLLMISCGLVKNPDGSLKVVEAPEENPAAIEKAYDDEIVKNFPCRDGYRNIWDKFMDYQDSFSKDAGGNTIEGPGTPVARSDLSNAMRDFFNSECCDKFYTFVMKLLDEFKTHNKIYSGDEYLFPENSGTSGREKLLFSDMNAIEAFINMVARGAFGNLENFYASIGDCALHMEELLAEINKFEIEYIDTIDGTKKKRGAF